VTRSRWARLSRSMKPEFDQLGEMVRGTVEETLNAMLDAEADQLCGAGCYERSEARQDTRAGSYERMLQAGAGQETALRCPSSWKHGPHTNMSARPSGDRGTWTQTPKSDNRTEP
jgi:hypothetical protein